MDASFFQSLQKQGRILAAWTIIEGQSYSFALFLLSSLRRLTSVFPDNICGFSSDYEKSTDNFFFEKADAL